VDDVIVEISGNAVAIAEQHHLFSTLARPIQLEGQRCLSSDCLGEDACVGVKVGCVARSDKRE